MKPKNKLTPSSPTTTRTQTKTQKTPKTHLKTHLNFTKNPKYIIPILLSSLKTPQNPLSFSTIKHCLTKLLHLIHPSSPLQCVQPHINTILALLPLLLHLHYNGLVGTVAKIVGCLSLFSMEVNGMIAGDKEVLKGLSLKVVTCEKWAVNKDVVNALLDVCVSCNGRESLVEVGGLDYLMLGSLQVKGSMEYSNSIDIMEKDGELCLGVESCQDELQLLFLNAVVTLTNFCSTEQLQQIPNKLSEAFFRYEKEIWFHIHKRLLGTNFTTYSQGKCSYLSSITAYNLAESIFRLSMYAPGVTCSVPSQIIVGHMFGRESSGYQKFMSDHWEASPFLISRQSTEMDVPLDIFSSFMGSLAGEESVAHFPSSLIEGMVSCPPIALDELDILGFLNDVKDTLGCPIMYQQDIRVVKTFSHSKTEKHYFQESSKKGIKVPKSFCAEDIEKCEAAFREGYTIALRGMEYRLKGIAAMTRVIAALFGQPSVGANLYVTPPNSQGLACHYDDHCVFVCQLHGTKQWTVYLQPIVQLPRLYEHLDVPEELLMEKREISLREGDILYIPRGLAHEACTITDPTPSADHSECSTHLTLAIEIEPPFEWAGFAHIALDWWSHQVNSDKVACDSPGNLQAMAVNILHVAIRLISGTEPLLRKACLVAASTLPPENENWLDSDQRTVFNQVISKIYELANFSDSLNFVRTTVQRDEDPLQWLRWLEHLNRKEDCDHDIYDASSAEFRKQLPFIYQHHDDAEATFVHLKTKFCNEILFDDAKRRFEVLHAMYKDARTQYMNGMLSLHH